MKIYDLIIIGAGPAGLTAALYAARAGLDIVLFEKMEPGGQVLLSEKLENYPGFKSISGRDLITHMKEQVEGFGVKIQNEEALKTEKQDDLFYINDTFKSRALIIASGAFPRPLGIEAEKRFIGRGVSYCAVCDGPFFKNKEIAVIGGGNAAVEEAIYLTRFASKVYIIHRRDELRAVKVLADEAKRHEKIEIVWDSVVADIEGENFVNTLKIKNVKTEQVSDLKVNGVFVYIGFEPNTTNFKNLVKTDDKGFIAVDTEMRTSEQGIFACGDCCTKDLRQVVTAASDGAVAANSVVKLLS